MVELLVAMLFILVLMAGMAQVYKASLQHFATAGESMVSARRNRLSLDLLVDDLNEACLYLMDLSVPPALTEAWPPFLVLPNMPVAGAGPDDPSITDELYFYLDQALPFEGVVGAGSTQLSAAQLVAFNMAPTAASATLSLNCGSASFANQVKLGQVLVFKDAWETAVIVAPPSVSGATVKVQTGPAPVSGVVGTGAGAAALRTKHLPGSRVVIVQPAQMVRYRLEMLTLDSAPTGDIPCLVRDQGDYNGAVFTPTQPRQIIAEQVTRFSVYLSANGGSSWAGWDSTTRAKATYTGFAAGWDAGLRAELDRQLAVSGRPDVRSTRHDPHWFRATPMLVRLDVESRAPVKRLDHAAPGLAPVYGRQGASLILAPRHAGLSFR